jgi:CheY-like chemotaxis protein
MGQKTVLVVEDEAAVRSLLSLVLETRDYRVLTAEDGQQALLQIHAERPDLILLDLMLPNVNGWSVIDELERDARLKQIPVIATSACQSADSLKGRGVRAFLSKPFDIDGLFRALDDIFAPAQSDDTTGSLGHPALHASPGLSDAVFGAGYGWEPHLG